MPHGSNSYSLGYQGFNLDHDSLAGSEVKSILETILYISRPIWKGAGHHSTEDEIEFLGI
jgi:hypothetical protein